MIINYLKTAWRSIANNKLYTFINIIGLAIGLGCFVLVLAFNRKELSYDAAFAKASTIFRVNTSLEINGVPTHYPMAHFPAGQDLTDEFPEVIGTARLYTPNLFGGNIPKIKNGDIVFPEERFFIVDSTFFSFFDYSFKYGDRATALNHTSSVVLTEPSAKRYFGEGDPVGKMLLYNDSISLRVTGVLNPINFNTHLQFDFVANARQLIRQNIPSDIDLENAYMGLWYYVYIMVDEKSNVETLDGKLANFVERYFTPRYKDNNAYIGLQNIKDIHLQSADMAAGQLSPPGNQEYVFILAIVGVCVLLVACFNFVNMATARYLARSREVGVRKAIGAERSQLIFQFISEASLITFFSGLVGLLLVVISLPFFNQLANSNLLLSEIFSWQDGLLFIFLFVVVGALSGIYPAFVLSSLKPALVLKGITQSPTSRFDIRKMLVVLQFAVALILVIGTFIVLSQLDYLRNKDMGFDKEQVLFIRDPGIPIFQRYGTFKNKLLELPDVKKVSHLSHDLGQANLPFFPFKREGKEEEMMLPILNTGFDFLETLGLEMAQGRYFDVSSPGDSTRSFVINESAARQFEWTDAVDKHITFGVGGSPDHRVIGVVKDFNFDPLRNAIGPLVISFSAAYGNIAIKLDKGDHQKQVERVEQQWKLIYPEAPFSYYFLDDGIANAYREEGKLAKIYGAFCGLAIFIACLGLFALASYTIVKRKKEMAIRKALGSSSSRVTLLIFREFLVLIAAGFALAAPAAFFVFDNWLSRFAYHVTISPFVFVMALAIVILLAVVTIAYQTIRAGAVNPAIVLKGE